MNNPKLLARLREFGRGNDAGQYLLTEHKQNLMQIRLAFESIARGPARYYSSESEADLPAALAEIQGFKVGAVFEARPIVIEFEAGSSGESFIHYTSSSNTSKMTMQIVRINNISGERLILASQIFRTGAPSGQAICGPGLFKWVDQPGPGQFEYSLFGYYDGGASSAGIKNCRLVAYQPK